MMGISRLMKKDMERCSGSGRPTQPAITRSLAFQKKEGVGIKLRNYARSMMRN